MDAGAFQVAEGARLGDVQECDGVVEGACFVLDLRRRQRTLCVPVGLSCQHGGAL
jgi:hypothetical protein